jgi:excisionase family DNA binding protein
MITINESNYLTIKESAKLLGVSIMTIRRWIDDKKIKVFKLSPRKLFINKSELEGILK